MNERREKKEREKGREERKRERKSKKVREREKTEKKTERQTKRERKKVSYFLSNTCTVAEKVLEVQCFCNSLLLHLCLHLFYCINFAWQSFVSGGWAIGVASARSC